MYFHGLSIYLLLNYATIKCFAKAWCTLSSFTHTIDKHWKIKEGDLNKRPLNIRFFKHFLTVVFDSTSQPNEYEQFLQHTYNIFLRGLEREEYKQENKLTVSPRARRSIVLESYKKSLDSIA